MRSSFVIGRVMGFPVQIHLSLFAVLPLFAMLFAYGQGDLFGFPTGFGTIGNDVWLRLSLGSLAAVMLFLTIAVHELAHCIVAKRLGWRVHGITLLIFGGLADLEEPEGEGNGEGVMALAGPTASLAIGVVFGLLYISSGGASEIWVMSLATLCSIIGIYNIVLGLFNLLPGFPMDGGRVLRAVLSLRMNREAATEVAVDTSKVFAVLMAGICILQWNLALVLLGIFLYVVASFDDPQQTFQQRLSTIQVSDVMSRGVLSIGADKFAKETWDRMMCERQTAYPVLEGSKVIGIVTLQDLCRVRPEDMPQTPVIDVIEKKIVRVRPDTNAITTLREMAGDENGRALIMSDDRLVGMVSRADLLTALSATSRQ